MKPKITKEIVKAASARYLKIVEWSDEDHCFVGRAPGLFFGGCHGADERKVYSELCDLVEEHLEELLTDREKLPTPTAGKEYSGKFNVRIGPELHQAVAMKALAEGISLNQAVADALSGKAEVSFVLSEKPGSYKPKSETTEYAACEVNEDTTAPKPPKRVKTISMVDLRTQSEKIVRELGRGVRMTLSYRGRPIAELVPVGAGEVLSPAEALSRAQLAAGRDAEHASKVAGYLRGLREDQKEWSERT